MTVIKLLKGLKVRRKEGPLNTIIKDIAYDSRLVKKDFLFVAIKGFSVNGHDYIKDAISRGATAIVAESAVEILNAKHPIHQNKITYIEVPDSREALALISSAFYKHPSKRLSLVGITGTNGKTTTSYIAKNIINAGGKRAGLLGSVQYITGEKTDVALNTTPESLDLQRYLSDMVRNKMEYAVIEVSSHALALKRVKGCLFKVVAFTNFSQDHLDFHGTMKEYFRAKSKIFSYLDAGGTAVLNWDDQMVKRLVQRVDCNIITCGIDKGAMLRAENVTQYQRWFRGAQSPEPRQAMSTGLSFDICSPKGRFKVNSNFIGLFNVYNILMSAGIAYSLGISEDVIKRGIQEAKPVEGRFENIDEGQDFLCIVDYAHTEDALRNILHGARTITRGRIITVFGCGGDRDRSKRPLMGAAASELSDLIIITSDNPRSEEPSEIIKDIVRGIKRNNYTIQPDREAAIKEAVSIAEKGDTLLVAGKGHEDYQEIKGVRHYFSDKEILRKEIKKLNKK